MYRRITHRRSGALATGAVAVALLFLVRPAGPLVAQTTYTVRGVVIDRAQDRPIPGATVTVGDGSRTTTDAEGRFEIRGVAPGRHPIVVEAVGYQTARSTILVTEDVDGRVEMDPQPIPLDPLAVRAQWVDVRGRAIDENGRSVPYVTARIDGLGETSTNDGGGFRIRGVPTGRHFLVIEGFGWLPERIPLEISGDTAVEIRMRRDGITERMIQDLFTKLDQRARGRFPRVLDRTQLARSNAPSVVEVIAARYNAQIVECPVSGNRSCFGTYQPNEPWVYIDDRLTFCGIEVLKAYPIASFDRIEMYGLGEIRAYTMWYVERLVTKRTTLPQVGPPRARIQC